MEFDVTDKNATLSLPLVGRQVIWRIFGQGESPLIRKTSFDLIEPIVRKHIREDDQGLVISEIAECFEIQGDQRWLKQDMCVPVAVLILDGVRDAVSYPNEIADEDTVFWAIGSIDPNIAAPIIRSVWSPDRIEAFAEYALEVLKSLSEADKVLDANRIVRIDSDKTKVSIKEVVRKDRLVTLQRIDHSSFYLYSGVANVIGLLVELNVDYFYALVERIEHLFVQASAADRMIYRRGTRYDPQPGRWVSETAPDDLVSLATVHAIEEVNSSDDEDARRGIAAMQEEDDQTVGYRSLATLVDRIDLIEPIRRAARIFDLFDYGRHALRLDSRSGKPRRVQQLDQLCVDSLVRLVQETSSARLLVELRSGLQLNDLSPSTFLLAEVASELRESHPERANEICGLILDLLEEKVDRSVSEEDSLYYSAKDWHGRDSILGFAVALAISDPDLDYIEWLSDNCGALPLSTWDREENYQSFLTADRIVHFRFLISLYAIQVRKQMGADVDADAILCVAEKLWEHCHFADTDVVRGPEDFDTAEYAARIALIFAEPSERWIIRQAKSSDVHLRTLFGLVDSLMSDQNKELGLKTRMKGGLVSVLSDTIGDRFAHIDSLNLTELAWLGRIWLSLKVKHQAARTASAILAFDGQRLNRSDKILALQLLAFATDDANQDSWRINETHKLYAELWPTTYTPVHEQVYRREIDAHLGR